jgi:diguanylate cyclase (GGDEF)-like protein/PAS domain S-box-containing protein
MPHQAEANLSALIESTHDLIWSVDLEYRLITFNKALQQHTQSMFGVQPVAGMLPQDLLPPERAGFMPPLYARALVEGSFREEFSLADGRTLELAFNPIIFDGKVTGISVFGKDITERKAAEESRRFLAGVVESCEEAIITSAPSGQILTWNHGAEAIYGYSADEVIGKPFFMMIAPEIRELADKQTRELLGGAPLLETLGVALRKDGSRTHVSVTTWPIRNLSGEVTAICTIVRDVSVHHEAEKTRALLASIVNSSGDAVHAVNLDGTVISWNRGAEDLFGYTSEEIIGKSIAMLAPPGRGHEVAHFMGAVATGDIVAPFDTFLRSKDGVEIEVSLSISPMRNSEGEVVGAAAIARDIRQRKMVERALRESLESLEEAQIIGCIGSYALDFSTGVWTSSDVLNELFGIDREYTRTVAGWKALIHPDDRAMIAAYFEEEVAGKGQNFSKEYRIVRQNDHAERWVHGIGRLEFDVKGQPLKMRGVIKDITESKLSEMQLRDSEERYRATFEQAAVGIVHTSFDRRYLRCNHRFAEIVGYPIEEVPGLRFEQVTVPEDIAETVEAHQRMMQGKVDSISFEKRYLRKDGSWTWARLTIAPQRDSEGRLLHLLAFVEDISDRKVAEEHLAAAMQALRLSEERYRLAFQTNFDSIDICSLEDGRFIDVNEAFLKNQGLKRDQVIGRTSLELGLWVNPADRQKLVDEIRRNSVCRNLEVPYRGANGSLRWGLMSVSPFEMHGVPCILSVTRDITDAKLAEERLAAAAEALRVSEERYRTVFQTSLDTISIARVHDMKFIDVNQALLDTLGYERKEVIGKTYDELGIFADDRDREAMKEMLRQNSGCRALEAQFRKKNQEIVWGEISASVVEIEGVPCILSVTRDITAAKAAEKTIRSLAFYDPLTGLPNRRQLLERLHQPPAAFGQNGRSMALLLIDLDHFKTFNDTLGHQTGDLLLKEVARRVAASVHEGDTACRMGGDEFVVMIESLSGVAEEAAAQAKAIGEHILAAIDRPYLIEDREYLLTASIGITIFGDRRENTDDVLQQADIAMDQAKAEGRNTMRFFSPALQAAVNARAAMEVDLRQAIKANQFLLYYQAQVERGRVTGVEALIRWNHPTRGLVMPNDFIPLAEESRLILPMGEWILETACAQIAAWARQKQTARLIVSVNISALQFRQPEFVEQVLSALARTGASPKNLRLELTESILVENIEEVIAKMTQLRLHGLRFSLDDFGTGYSSLAYLKRLPLDCLKIDRSFVRDILVDSSSGAIAQTIISLGRAMAMSVIAEGVETEEQRSFLAALGCHAFQGFLFSRPIPLEQFESLLHLSFKPRKTC